MRAFVLLGALSVVRGSQLPVPNNAKGRLAGWKYYAAQTGELPADWATKVTDAGDCAKTSQSPINIDTTALTVMTTDEGNVTGMGHEVAASGTVFNDGRSITYQVTSPLKPYIMGGPLTAKKTFILDHLSFHFGSVSTQGSEHQLNAKKYPMELQLVYYDNAQLTAATAAPAKAPYPADAIAVVSYLFEIDTTDNAALAPIVTEIPNVKKEVKDAGIKKEKVALDLLMIIGDQNLEEYYYYDGSLTTPLCYENVKQIVSPKMLKISEAQLAVFRTLEDADGQKVADNFRPVQALGTRKVMHRKKPSSKSSTYEGAVQNLASSLLGIGTFSAVYNLLTQPDTAKALKANPILDLIEDFDQKFIQGEAPVEPQFVPPQQFQKRF